MIFRDKVYKIVRGMWELVNWKLLKEVEMVTSARMDEIVPDWKKRWSEMLRPFWDEVADFSWLARCAHDESRGEMVFMFPQEIQNVFLIYYKVSGIEPVKLLSVIDELDRCMVEIDKDWNTNQYREIFKSMQDELAQLLAEHYCLEIRS